MSFDEPPSELKEKMRACKAPGEILALAKAEVLMTLAGFCCRIG